MFRDKLTLYLDLIRWNRPAGWLLLLWPTLSALWIAAHGFPGWHLLAIFTLGTVLMRSAGCCLNDVADRDFDRHVKRTAQRPVTRGADHERGGDHLVFRGIGDRPGLSLRQTLRLHAAGGVGGGVQLRHPH